ncbi:MAG: Gfo/Idh/MocA family oxidoreductase [Ignavibacteriales bacterium]|nr:Gfo/Idh/MocA family oxidoreductase [Melioribacteraceae bacterium]MCF8315142.1 Gfo/Idh/MocA family oxidoreductase [Ignavibacteriales bacterium]MCF8435862.1 Gfo/Idh/MocA family oxidoreductase [Ignavibacteriales bacterium]
MRVGIVGFGSIGQRHTQNLINLGVQDLFLLRLKGRGNKLGISEYYSVDSFFCEDFDFVIVAVPTSEHIKLLKEVILRGRNFLCEKPLVSSFGDLIDLEQLLQSYSKFNAVAMNMRYHPCIIAVRNMIRNKVIGEILSASFFVGQYLPDWRPGRDYSNTYSAKRELGGGVTLDLIHEIDLAVHLLGKPTEKLVSIAGKFSSLAIETEDITEIAYISERKCLVSLHMDYVFRGYKREITLLGTHGHIIVDLHTNKINVSNEDCSLVEEIKYPHFERNDMYLQMLSTYISDLNNGTFTSPSVEEGLLTNKIALTVLEQNGLNN